eukprot:6531756-Karenia_brevis.AAC.1
MRQLRLSASCDQLQCSHLGMREGWAVAASCAIARCDATVQGQLLRSFFFRSLHVISFYAAISACEMGGQWQRVAPLLDEMQ